MFRLRKFTCYTAAAIRQLSLSHRAAEKITLDEQIRRVAKSGKADKPSQIYEILANQRVINDDQFQVSI